MELAQALSRMPIEEVADIADYWRIDAPRHSKSRLLDAITAHFRSPRSMKAAVSSLEDDEVEVLRCCLHLTPGVSDLDDLINAFHPVDGSGSPLNLPETVERLMLRGLLIPEGDFTKTERFFMPSDLRRSLATHLLPKTERSLVVPEGEADRVFSRPVEFLEDLFGYVCVLEKEPARLTAEGAPFKRSLERVFRRFRVPLDDGLLGLPTELPQFPGRLDLIQEFAREEKLTRKSDSEIRVGTAWEDWLDKDRLTMTREVFHYFEGKHVKGDFQLRGILAYLSGNIDTDEWIPLNRALDEVFSFGENDSALLQGTRRKAYYLAHMLMNMGLLELAAFERDRVVAYRSTDTGRRVLGDEGGAGAAPAEETRLTIQPNFEILAAPDTPFRLRWKLERIADLASQDVILTYRITKESLYSGLRSGMEWGEIEDILENHLTRECPQNVRHNLESWCSRFGEITFMEGLLMRCRTKELAEEISHLPDVAPYIKGNISSKALLIDAKHYEKVIEALEEHGYMPEPKE
jgi:hypothetical protein